MADVTVFKVERLTEGGFVIYAPGYSQFSENLDLANKRLIVKVEAWAKDLSALIQQEKLEQSPSVKR